MNQLTIEGIHTHKNYAVKSIHSVSVTRYLTDIAIALQNLRYRVFYCSEEFNHAIAESAVLLYNDYCTCVEHALARSKDKVICVLDNFDVAVKNSSVSDKVLPILKSGKVQFIFGMQNGTYVPIADYKVIEDNCIMISE